MMLLQVLKALGDETRIRMLNLLRDRALCVCEIEHLLGIQQSNASRHLNKLSGAQIIDSEKRGLYIYYRINEKVLAESPFIRSLLEDEFKKLEACRLDTEKLREFLKEGTSCEALRNIKDLCEKDKEHQ